MGPPPLSIGLEHVDIRIAVAAFNCCDQCSIPLARTNFTN
jgi:hypothetical protein